MSETVVTEDLAAGITSPEERHDEVHVIGSLNLVQSLLLGSGKRVFADGTVPTARRLTESVPYPNGTLQPACETAGAPAYGDLA